MAGENDVNSQVTADVSDFSAAMREAQTAAQQAFANIQTSADSATAHIVGLQASAQRMAKDFQLRDQIAAIDAFAAKLQVGETEARKTAGTLEGLGITASLSGRKLSAMIDEALAGRWRQFDGTVASVFGRMASANALLTAQVAVVGAAAVAIGVMAYQWWEVNSAIEAARGEMLIAGTLVPDSTSRIKATLDSLRNSFGLSAGDAATLTKAFGALPPAAAPLSDALAKLAAAQEQLIGGDVGKYAEDLAKHFSEGGKGALQWADAHHILTEQQRQELEILQKSGSSIEVMNRVIDAATTRFASQAQQIAQAKKEWQEYVAIQGLSAGQANIPAPDFEKQFVQPGASPVNAQEEEYKAVVDKVNTALAKRAEILTQIETVGKAWIAAQEKGDSQAEYAAQEAIASLQKQLAETHTALEQRQHEQILEHLQVQLAAEKDFGAERIKILQQIYNEQASYAGKESAAARAADIQVTAAKRQYADQQVEIEVEKFRQQETAEKGHYDVILAIEDKILALLKQHYGEASRQYQEEANKRVEYAKEEARQREEIARQDATTQAELARITAQKVQLETRAVMAGSAKFPSFLELFGGRDQSAEVQAELAQIRTAFEQTMAAIKAAEAQANDPAQLNALLNKEKIEQQQYALDVEKIHLQAAEQTRKAWDNVFQNMETNLNRSIVGMINGTMTFQKAMFNVYNSILSMAIEVPLKMLESWINGEIEKWLFTDSAEAAGRALQVSTGAEAIATNAAVAASGSYASVSAIPYIGWAMAPGVAAQAFGTVMGFESLVGLDQGAWEVPNDMVAQIHAGESVVPQTFASGLRESGVLDKGGESSGGGGNTINVNLSPQTPDPATMMNWLNANAPMIARVTSRYMTNNPSSRPSY